MGWLYVVWQLSRRYANQTGNLDTLIVLRHSIGKYDPQYFVTSVQWYQGNYISNRICFYLIWYVTDLNIGQPNSTCRKLSTINMYFKFRQLCAINYHFIQVLIFYLIFCLHTLLVTWIINLLITQNSQKNSILNFEGKKLKKKTHKKDDLTIIMEWMRSLSTL